MKTAFSHKEAATKFVWHLGTKDPKVVHEQKELMWGLFLPFELNAA
jgi:hypothetical protein